MDESLRLVDCSKGDMLNTFKGHSNQSLKLNSCFGKDDKYVLSGSEDGSIWMWDLLEGEKPLAVLKNAHTNVVTCVKYNETEDCILSTSLDGKIKVWKCK